MGTEFFTFYRWTYKTKFRHYDWYPCHRCTGCILEKIMINTIDAFKKFKSRLELRVGEQTKASELQKEVRALIAEHFCIARDFLTGSYKRHTKTRPLKDVDIFFVFDKEKEKKYLNKPLDLLEDIRK